MALPTSMRIGLRGTITKAGFTLDVFPSTEGGLSVEVQSATAAGAATSKWASVILPPSSAGKIRYFFAVNNSTKAYYFRARHPAQAGYSAGAFTTTLVARPYVHPIIQPRYFPQLTYKGNVEIPAGSDVYLSSGKTVRVGTQVTTGKITKYLVLPYTAFRPAINTASYSMTVTGLQPGAAATATTFYGTLALPNGAIATSFACEFYKETTGDTAIATFRGRTVGAGTINISTATAATTNWILVGGGAGLLPIAISSAIAYQVRLRLTGVAAGADARIGYARIKYTMPSYDRAI